MNAFDVNYEQLLTDIKNWKLKKPITSRMSLGLTIGAILIGNNKPILANNTHEILKIIDILLDIDHTIIDSDNDYVVIGYKGASWPGELSVIRPHYYVPIKINNSFLTACP